MNTTKNKPNTFCCDISVTENGKSRVVQTGDHATIDGTSLALGCFTAFRYYIQDRPELSSATVTLFEVCGSCGGTGIIQGKGRNRYRQTSCKCCKARGNWPIHVEEIVRVP